MPLLTTPDDQDLSATWEVVGNGRRFSGYLIDMFLLNPLASGVLAVGRSHGWVPAMPANPFTAQPGELFPILLVMMGVQAAYYFLWETLAFRTPGKFVCQTRVMRVDGDDPTALNILLRTLVRFVPLEPISFLFPLPGGWHDRWTGTCVVRRTDGLPPEDDEYDVG